MLGQLPPERITPGSVFDKVGIDYAGPVLIKYGYVRKPTIVKAYICVFVSLSVKAVHLELVTDLTADAFIASLRRFVAMSTVLCQIEATLDSRPLTPVHNDDDGIETLTPGHFLINQPLKALPDASAATPHPLSLLKRWQLCQTLVQHFWKRFSTEHLSQIGKFYKWQHPTRNIHVGDLVVVKEDAPIRNRWPLAKILNVYPGKDGLVRVAQIKTADGIYIRPIIKLAVILPTEEQ